MVQLLHSSVKEYLTSHRLATRSEDFSRYHILLEPAHITLAQACVGVLLLSGDRIVQGDIDDWFQSFKCESASPGKNQSF